MAPPRAVPTPAGGSDRDFQQGPPVSRSSAERLVPVSLPVLEFRLRGPELQCGTEEMSPPKREMGFLCCLSLPISDQQLEISFLGKEGLIRAAGCQQNSPAVLGSSKPPVQNNDGTKS